MDTEARKPEKRRFVRLYQSPHAGSPVDRAVLDSKSEIELLDFVLDKKRTIGIY